MEYSEAEKQMLREVLPGIAVQLRGALACCEREFIAANAAQE